MIQVGLFLYYLLYFVCAGYDDYENVSYSVQFTVSGVTLLNSVVLAIIACLDKDYKYFWAFAAIEFAFSTTCSCIAFATMCDNLDCPECDCEEMCKAVNKYYFE